MYRADKLYNDMMAVDTAIKQLKVEDEASWRSISACIRS